MCVCTGIKNKSYREIEVVLSMYIQCMKQLLIIEAVKPIVMFYTISF